MGGTKCLLLSSCCFLRRWPKWSNGVLEITMGMELMLFAKLDDFGLTIETRILASMEMFSNEKPYKFFSIEVMVLKEEG